VRVDHAIFEKMGTIFSGVDEVEGWNPKAFYAAWLRRFSFHVPTKRPRNSKAAAPGRWELFAFLVNGAKK
jgi:hypothetical protein